MEEFTATGYHRDTHQANHIWRGTKADIYEGGHEWERAPVVSHSVGGMFCITDGKWKLIAGNGSGGRQSPKGKPFARALINCMTSKPIHRKRKT